MTADRMPPSDSWSPGQALAYAGSEKWGSVLVVGYDDDGELRVRFSKMSPAEALWLLEQARDWAKESDPLRIGLAEPL